MNRTEFIGTYLYYSQDFVDDLYKEIERLNSLLKGEHEVNQMYLNNINKAIDYIKEKSCNFLVDLRLEELEDLLDILEGKDD